MQIHQLQPIHKVKSRKRVGRGGKKGTYSGRGVKGQNSRSGKGMRPSFAGGDTPLFKRFSKIRGSKKRLAIRHGVKGIRYRINYQVVNVKDLEENFKSGEKINPEILIKNGLIRGIKKMIPPVKILGDGELTKKLEITGCRFSKSAEEKIKKAGGVVV